MFQSTHRKYVIFFQLIFFVIMVSGQNLVENGSFEELSKKPKEPGEIFLAPPWVSGTKASPDLYSKDAKDDRIRVPKNSYGDEKPKDGENYAGLMIYSDKEKEPRSYLSAKLKYPMLAGEYYCVKFHISLADLSRYACNNIGCFVSRDSIGSENNLMLNFEPQVINSTNRIYEQQWSWEPICRIYVADGGEQFITIGNFAPQEKLLTKSVKRPSGYTQSQTRDGYFFIDDISVTPNATPENCKCEPGKFAFANLNKEEASFETAEKDVPKKVILGTNAALPAEQKTNLPSHKDVIVGFALGKSDLTGAALTMVNEAIEFMNKNVNSKVNLIGHIDDSEKVIKGLGNDRIEQIAKYLMSKGIDEKRISKKDLNFTKPLDASGLKENREKNMVVEMTFSN